MLEAIGTVASLCTGGLTNTMLWRTYNTTRAVPRYVLCDHWCIWVVISKMYQYVYIYVYMWVYVYVCVCLCVCVHVWLYLSVYVLNKTPIVTTWTYFYTWLVKVQRVTKGWNVYVQPGHTGAYVYCHQRDTSVHDRQITHCINKRWTDNWNVCSVPVRARCNLQCLDTCGIMGSVMLYVFITSTLYLSAVTACLPMCIAMHMACKSCSPT